MPHDPQSLHSAAERYIGARLRGESRGDAPHSEPAARSAPLALRELLARPELLVPPPAVLAPIAYEGRVTLLSAREKTGKSTLVGQAVAALSTGGDFLGTTLAPASVLWYAIDEPLGDTVRRFQQHDANPDRIFIQQDRPTATDLRRDIEATGAHLVVVDTLTELWNGIVESEKDAQEVAQLLRPYVTVARDTGASLLLLHHTTKAGREYRGSVQIGASVDCVLTLKKVGSGRPEDGDDEDDDGEDDGRRTLRGKGRGIDVNLRLFFDGTQYALGDAPLPIRLRILRALQEHESTGSALAERLGKRKSDVLDELRGLRDEGAVMTVAGKYRITPNGEAELRRVVPVPGSRTPIADGPGTDSGTNGTGRALAAGNRGTQAEPGRNSLEPAAGTSSPRLVPELISYDTKSGTGALSLEPGDVETDGEGNQTLTADARDRMRARRSGSGVQGAA